MPAGIYAGLVTDLVLEDDTGQLWLTELGETEFSREPLQAQLMDGNQVVVVDRYSLRSRLQASHLNLIEDLKARAGKKQTIYVVWSEFQVTMRDAYIRLNPVRGFATGAAHYIELQATGLVEDNLTEIEGGVFPIGLQSYWNPYTQSN